MYQRFTYKYVIEQLVPGTRTYEYYYSFDTLSNAKIMLDNLALKFPSTRFRLIEVLQLV